MSPKEREALEKLQAEVEEVIRKVEGLTETLLERELYNMARLSSEARNHLLGLKLDLDKKDNAMRKAGL